MNSRERPSHVLATVVSPVKFAAINLDVTFPGRWTVLAAQRPTVNKVFQIQKPLSHVLIQATILNVNI